MEHWFEYVVTALIGLGGWIMNNTDTAIKEQGKRIHSIEVKVAGEYLRKEEFERFSEAIFNKLDRIEDKIDKKVDK